MMVPFTPHFCEECWELIGKKSFVSNEKWPKASLKVINPEQDYSEELIKNTLSDMRQVLKLAKVEKLTSIRLFVSEAWKYDLFRKANGLLKKTRNSKEILGQIMKDEKFKMHGNKISKFFPNMLSNNKLPAIILTQKQEFTAIKESLDFIKNEFNCDVSVTEAEKSKEAKAKQAMPGKVAILVK